MIVTETKITIISDWIIPAVNVNGSDIIRVQREETVAHIGRSAYPVLLCWDNAPPINITPKTNTKNIIIKEGTELPSETNDWSKPDVMFGNVYIDILYCFC